MVKCVVPDCDMRYSGADAGDGLKFFAIPPIIEAGPLGCKERSQVRRRAWLLLINNDELKDEFQKTTRKICSRHFISGQPAGSNDEKNPDWLPTLHMGSASSPQNENAKKDGKGKPGRRRSSKHKSAESVASTSTDPKNDAGQRRKGSTADTVTSVKSFTALQEEMAALRQENEALKEANTKLRNRLKKIGDLCLCED